MQILVLLGLACVAFGLLFTPGLGAAASRPQAETGSPLRDTSPPAYLVRDIYTGTESAAPTDLTAVGNLLFFVADDGLHGRELWALQSIALPCIEVGGVSPAQVTAAPIYPDTPVLFSATIEPPAATSPYSYTLDGGGTMIAAETTFTFAQAFAAPGTHTIEVAAWSCEMVLPVTDRLSVEVSARTIYLSLVQQP